MITTMATGFSGPEIEFTELGTVLIVLGAGVIGVLFEAFLPRGVRYLSQFTLTVTALLAALVWLGFTVAGLPEYEGGGFRGVVAVAGAVAIDGPTVYLWGLILVIGLLGTLLFAERQLDGGLSPFAGQAAALPGTDAESKASAEGMEHTEVYPLLLFAIGGMLLFPASNDLITMFIALEVLSLPLYLLCGLARRRRLLSQEAALKYFLLGAFSSGFYIYGAALVYGYAGSVNFAEIDAAVGNATQGRGLLLAGIALVSVGLLFKVGAAPFQAWTPDVYQGAPTAVTAFMSAGTKVAAFGALLRFFYVAVEGERWSWQPILMGVAILTMLVGSVMAIAQTDVKRMLGYSSVAHTGFLLTGVLGLKSAGDLGEGEISSLTAVLFYLTPYAFLILGSFALVTMVRDAGGEATSLSRWAGLGRTSPVLAAIFTLFLFAMAGIPLTAGFVGKWAVFAAAMSAGAWPAVLVAVLCSVMAAFFYVRVVWVMYFSEPEGAGPTVTYPSWMTMVPVALAVAVTVVLGLVPGPLLDLVANAGGFIR